MPGNDGRLTKEEKDKAVSWLKEKWTGDKTCPVCSANDWYIADHITAQIVVGQGGGVVIGGTTYPLISVTCTNCGYARHHNAVVMKIFTSSSEPVRSDKDDG